MQEFNLSVLVPVLITAAIAIVGWYVAHRLTQSRDVAAKRKELRVKYLIEAYRRLEAAGSRPSSEVGQYLRDFESAIADIHLLGTPLRFDSRPSWLRKFRQDHQMPAPAHYWLTSAPIFGENSS